MAINKIVYGGKPLIDLTDDSVTPQTLLEGHTAHDKSGQYIAGIVPIVRLTVDDNGCASFGFVVDENGNGLLSCIAFSVNASGDATVT